MSAHTEDVARQMRQLFDVGSGVGLTDGEHLARFAGREESGPNRDSGSAEAAFETLLARHGSMVLSVCRHVLGDLHAADDAFQATFLVLIRRSGSLGVRECESLGPWLYGVAYRTAIKARRLAERRRERERQVAMAATAGSDCPDEPDDLRSVLHEEISRLPAKYRAPVVLCYFEGRTHEEAAGALHWPVGTVRGRLARARVLLRSRLTRRGLAPAVVVGASAFEPFARAEVAMSLRDATVAAAIKGAPAGASVDALTKIVLRSLIVARLKMRAVAVLAIALLGTGAGAVVRNALAVQPPDRSSAPKAAATAERAPTALVDRFGDLLPAGAHARMGTVRFRHGDFVSNALYTPQGGLVVSVSDGGNTARVGGSSIRVWDAATGRKLREIGDFATRFLWIALSPDGRTLATVEEPNRLRLNRLRLWDLATGRELRRWHEAANQFYHHLVFSPDGQTVAAGVYRIDEATKKAEQFVNAWDTAARTERRRRFGGDWLALLDLKISPDGKSLATATDDTEPNAMGVKPEFGEKPEKGSTRIWDLATAIERKRFSVEGCIVRSVAFSPDGKLLAASVTDGSMRLYDLTTGQERLPRLVPEKPHRPPPPKPLGAPPPASPPGQLGLVPAPAGGAAGDSLPEAMQCLTFSPDGTILAGGFTGTGNWRSSALAAVHLWDVARGNELRRIPAHRFNINSLAFSPDGKTLATTGGELVVRLWDVATGNERLPQEGHRSPIVSLEISPADGLVFTAGADRTVRRWDPLTGRELGVFATFADPVGGMAFSLDGKTLLIGNASSGLALWSVAERREIRRLARIQDGNDVRYAGDFARLLAIDVRTRIQDGNAVRYAGPFYATAYSPDGQEFITVAGEGVCIRDAVSGKEVRWAVRSSIDNHTPALAPDGRILATGTDYTRRRAGKLNVAIHLWELASGREVARLEGLEENEGINDLAYSPNGRLLVACCNRSPGNPRDQMIRIWDVVTAQEVRRFTGHLAPAWSAAFTADGRSIISGGADGTALVWDVSDLQKQPNAGPLTADALKARWDELASSDARVAYRATWALSIPSAVPFLREHLSADIAPAYKGTGVTEGPVGPPVVLRTLRAIAALERIGTPEAREALLPLAHGDPAALVTREARSSLSRLRNRRK